MVYNEMVCMKRLIPNNVSVSEQLALMEQFNDTIDQAWRVHARTGTYENIDAKRDFIEQRFGISCTVLHPNNGYMSAKLVEPRVVDEKKCLFYLIATQ